ncbi:hypothetical protein [Poseidonocella sp. HB161398]|uniref:hypothetical protein n=1 Tax=Poseidonocella sp. HB161398 TaxID=2320855 RepID=UPI001108D4CE|nr:hypothetical protein [Poseidonocella sp. HB161398]
MPERVKPKPGKYKELGQKIVEWTKDNSTLPGLDPDGTVTDLAAFREEMKDIVHLPDTVTSVRFVIPKIEDPAAETFTYIVRLPLKELVEQSEAELGALDQSIAEEGAVSAGSPYDIPAFYLPFLTGDPDVPKYLDMLYRRIADYTFAHCK